MAGSQVRRILLLHPPYADYTSPYHSLAYVASVAQANGYAVDVLDINAIWFRSLFTSGRLAQWQREFDAELAQLNAQPALTIDDQERVIELIRAVRLCGGLHPENAVAVLQSERFYDWTAYQRARADVRAFETLLNMLYHPFDFYNAFAVPPHEPDPARLVGKARASERLIHDFCAILAAHCREDDYLFCGVSVPYSANLLPAMALAIALQRMFPQVPRVAGGTAISDLFKYRNGSNALAPFGDLWHMFYVGEAEPGFRMLAAYCSGECNVPPPQVIPLPGGNQPIQPPRYVSLAGAADVRKGHSPFDWRAHPPDFGWVDWNLYLSPERRVLYAPVRGCFWNQCTFCDYGLNDDRPTAPSRTMPADIVVDHLRMLARQGVTRIYFAADAIPPGFLHALADGIIESGIEVAWSCQLFLTKSFSRDLVDKLQRSGLKIASFGLESGSDRVLEMMGKGRNRINGTLRPALGAFRLSDVALQPLFFFGFPTETDQDRQATVDFLLEYADLFTPISRGGMFTLLAGSIMARDPAKFGIRDARRRDSDGIAWDLDYNLADGGPPSESAQFKCFDEQLPYNAAFERPWVGGVDTFHTQLYVEKFGRDAFNALQRPNEHHLDVCIEAELQFNFDLEAVAQNVQIRRALRCEPHQSIAQMAHIRIGREELAEIFLPLERSDERRAFSIRIRRHEGRDR